PERIGLIRYHELQTFREQVYAQEYQLQTHQAQLRLQSTLIQTQHQLHETHSQIQQTEIAGLRETDRVRQSQIIETLRVMRDMRQEMGDMQAEMLALRRQPRRAGQPGGNVRVPNHQDAPRDADSSRYEVGESSMRGRGVDYGFADTVKAEMRHRGIGEVGYGIRDTWIDLAEAVPEMAPTTLEKVNTRVTKLAELHEHDTHDLYALLEDARDGRTRISQRVAMDSQRVDLLMGDMMTL
nr:hypothetical protein [Tanacetum cinerariifolium]